MIQFSLKFPVLLKILNLFISGSLLVVNVSISHQSPNYLPNCDLIGYLYVNGNLVDYKIKPIDIMPFSIKNYTITYDISNYKSGNYTVSFYISCEKFNLVGNHISFQGGVSKTVFIRNNGIVPVVQIDRNKTTIAGDTGQRGPYIPPGTEIPLEIYLKAYENFTGKLIISLCEWDNIIYSDQCKKIIEKDIALKKDEEKFYLFFTNFPTKCSAYNYEIKVVDNQGNVHDIWTLRGVTKCLQLHYVYTYFTPNGYAVIITGPYDPNIGYAAGNVSIFSQNYTHQEFVKLKRNEIKIIKDNVTLENICIKIENNEPICRHYNVSKYYSFLEKQNEIIRSYLQKPKVIVVNKTTNKTISSTNISSNVTGTSKTKVKEKTTEFILFGILMASLVVLFLILYKLVS